MEKKLSRLFDFQKYEGNKAMEEILKEVDGRYPTAVELSDDELFGVAAAQGVVLVEEDPLTDKLNKMIKKDL